MQKSNDGTIYEVARLRVTKVPSWKLFIFLASVHCISLVLLHSRYWVNDDLAMLYFSDGEWTGSPERNLIFSHPIFGALVSSAYKIFPGISWYPYFLLLTIVLSYVALARYVGTKRIQVFVIFVAAVSVIQFTLVPTFTFAAIICAGLGLATLFVNNESKNLIKSLIGLSIFSLGILIRPESKFVAAAIALPIILSSWKQVLSAKSSTKIVGQTVLTVLALSVAFLVQAGSIACNSNQPTSCNSWNIYTKYNYERGQFHGTPNMEFLENNHSSLGWTKLDMRLFSSWLYPDDQKFGPEVMTKAFEMLTQDTSYRPYQLEEISPYKIFQSLPAAYFSLIGFVFALGATGQRKNVIQSNSFFIPGLTFAAWFFLMLLLSSIRVPQTVTIPAIILCSVLIAIAFDQHRTRRKNLARRVKQRQLVLNASLQSLLNNSLAVLMTIFIVLFSQEMYSRNDLNNSLNSSSRSSLQLLEDSVGKNPILISANLSDTFLNHDPWKRDLTLGRTQIQLMGWPVFSPHNEKRLVSSGLNGMFAPYVFGSRDYVSGYSFCGSPSQAKSISKYMLQEYGYQNVPKQISNVKGVCKVWIFKPA
jgi:hypothetical protein